MTMRKVQIERLELRFSAGVMKGANVSPAALNKLARAVAEQLAKRIESEAPQKKLPRSIELSLPAGAANADRIAAAIDRSMRRPSTGRRQERK